MKKKKKKETLIPIQTIGYGESHKIRVKIPFPIRKGVCQVCGKSIAKGEIKTTQMHHFKYKYRIATVKANPLLALENTIEVCYGCHQILDGLRAILRMSPQRVVQAILHLPDDQQKKMKKICYLYWKVKKK